MSGEQQGAQGDPVAAGTGVPGAGREPSEAELRAAYEAELARITSTDMILQAAVSLLNLGSYRLAPRPPAGAEPGPGEPAHGAGPGAGQDLEQVRDSIDAVRALLEILERRVPSELRPLRDALSQLQMVYAREVGPGGAAPAGGAGPGSGEGEGGAGSSGGSSAPGGTSPGSDRPGGDPGPGAGGPGSGEPGPDGAPASPGQQSPGPAERSGRLWVPGR